MTDDGAVEFWGNLNGGDSLIPELVRKCQNAILGLQDVDFNTLDRDCGLLDVNIYTELFPIFADVATAFADEVLLELLGEIKGDLVAGLEVLVFGFLDKLFNLDRDGINIGRWSTDGDGVGCLVRLDWIQWCLAWPRLWCTNDDANPLAGVSN